MRVKSIICWNFGDEQSPDTRVVGNTVWCFTNESCFLPAANRKLRQSSTVPPAQVASQKYKLHSRPWVSATLTRNSCKHFFYYKNKQEDMCHSLCALLQKVVSLIVVYSMYKDALTTVIGCRSFRSPFVSFGYFPPKSNSLLIGHLIILRWY